jgi:hypothetical protein
VRLDTLLAHRALNARRLNRLDVAPAARRQSAKTGDALRRLDGRKQALIEMLMARSEPSVSRDQRDARRAGREYQADARPVASCSS